MLPKLIVPHQFKDVKIIDQTGSKIWKIKKP